MRSVIVLAMRSVIVLASVCDVSIYMSVHAQGQL